MKRVSLRAFKACTYISARRLVAPMTLVGRTALSVEIMTKSSTPVRSAALATTIIPRTLFLTASALFASICAEALGCMGAWVQGKTYANEAHVWVSAASASASLSLLTNAASYRRFRQASAMLLQTEREERRI